MENKINYKMFPFKLYKLYFLSILEIAYMSFYMPFSHSESNCSRRFDPQNNHMVKITLSLMEKNQNF